MAPAIGVQTVCTKVLRVASVLLHPSWGWSSAACAGATVTCKFLLGEGASPIVQPSREAHQGHRPDGPLDLLVDTVLVSFTACMCSKDNGFDVGTLRFVPSRSSPQACHTGVDAPSFESGNLLTHVLHRNMLALDACRPYRCTQVSKDGGGVRISTVFARPAFPRHIFTEVLQKVVVQQ